jgi:hypothetical protein
VCVFASFAPKPGREAQVRAVLDEVADKTRTEPGCELYDIYQSTDSKDQIHLFERYTPYRKPSSSTARPATPSPTGKSSPKRSMRPSTSS